MRKKYKTESRRGLKTAVALLSVCVLMLTFIASGILPFTAYAADTTILLSGSDMEQLRPGETTWYQSIVDQYDTVWTADTQVDIFKISYENDNQEVTVAGKNNSKVIAPGTENSYSFAIKNTGPGLFEYKVITEAWVTSESGNITEFPVLARMQGLDWFVGGENEWRPVLELNGAQESGFVQGSEHVLYTLQWQWPFEQDLNGDGNIDDGDALDTWLATQGDVTLTIKINVIYGYRFPQKPSMNTPIPDAFEVEDHHAYLYGYSDGTIRPNSSITRAEAAVIFYRVLKEEVRAQYRTDICSYTDIVPGTWCSAEIATLSAMGILNGYSDGTFRPNEHISRAALAAILARFSNAISNGEGKTEFADIDDSWARNEIMLVEDLGWIEGYPDGSFRPTSGITRAELVTMINRMIHRLPESVDDLLPGMKTWSDNADEEAWYYLAIQEASNGHTYERLLGTREKWLELTGA